MSSSLEFPKILRSDDSPSSASPQKGTLGSHRIQSIDHRENESRGFLRAPIKKDIYTPLFATMPDDVRHCLQKSAKAIKSLQETPFITMRLPPHLYKRFEKLFIRHCIKNFIFTHFTPENHAVHFGYSADNLTNLLKITPEFHDFILTDDNKSIFHEFQLSGGQQLPRAKNGTTFEINTKTLDRLSTLRGAFFKSLKQTASFNSPRISLISEKIFLSINPNVFSKADHHLYMKTTISKLFKTHHGICIGENHFSPLAKKFLIDQMPIFAQQGIKTIFLENITRESCQKLLDDFFFQDTLKMKKELEVMLDFVDVNTELEDSLYNIKNLVFAAKKSGIHIECMENELSRHQLLIDEALLGLSDSDETDRRRDATLNMISSHIVTQHARGKYIILAGAAHVIEHSQIPGIADILRCRSVFVGDEELIMDMDEFGYDTKKFNLLVSYV